MQKLISSESFSQQFFTLIGGQVVKAILTVKGGELLVEDPGLAEVVMKLLIASGSVTRPVVNLAIGAASEADVLAAQKAKPGKAIGSTSCLHFCEQPTMQRHRQRPNRSA